MTTLELVFSFNEATDRRTRTRHYIQVAAPLRLVDRELPVHPWILGLWLEDGDSDSAVIYCSPDDEIHCRASAYRSRTSSM